MCVCMFVHVCRLISRIRNRLHSLFPFTQQGASAMTSKVSEMQVRCLNNLAAAQLKARGACARECHDTSRVLSSLSLTLLTSLPHPPPPPSTLSGGDVQRVSGDLSESTRERPRQRESTFQIWEGRLNSPRYIAIIQVCYIHVHVHACITLSLTVCVHYAGTCYPRRVKPSPETLTESFKPEPTRKSEPISLY